jgi:hypothetical protein
VTHCFYPECASWHRKKDVRYVLGGADSCNCKSPKYTNPAHCLYPYGGVSLPETVQPFGSCTPSLFDVPADVGVSNALTCCDTYPDSRNNDLAVNCESNLQGSNRLQRGLNYMSYLRYYYNVEQAAAGANDTESFAPTFAIVPGLLHDATTFYASDVVQEWVYRSAGDVIIVPPPLIPQPTQTAERPVHDTLLELLPILVVASLIVLLGVLGHFTLVAVTAILIRIRDHGRRQEQRNGAVDETTHLLA